MRVSAQVKSNALEARAFLDHEADGVNGFLIQASVAMQDPCAHARVSMTRPQVTTERRHAVAL
jgi:hypothetical protein